MSPGNPHLNPSLNPSPVSRAREEAVRNHPVAPPMNMPSIAVGTAHDGQSAGRPARLHSIMRRTT